MVMNRGLGDVNWFDAKRECAELNKMGFINWYLPSKEELVMIFKMKNKSFYKGLKPGWYWSSTEKNDKKAYNVWYDSGWASDETKKTRIDCLCVHKIN
jgi:hypothetical protein